MDFLLYLTPTGQQIIDSIIKAKFNVRENSPLCRVHKEIYGYVFKKDFVVCITNIKNTTNLVSYYVNETVHHEAVHVAQTCKRKPLGIKPTLSFEKMNNVNRSVKYNKDAFTLEVEAYYLEDKPEQILPYVQKYCF